jgi:hypothetical protein
MNTLSTVILIPMHVLPVGGLFVTALFKALDTARYLHKPVRIPFLDQRIHIDVSFVVLPSEENDEGTDRGFRCGTQVGLSTWVSELLFRTLGQLTLNFPQFSGLLLHFWKRFHLSD